MLFSPALAGQIQTVLLPLSLAFAFALLLVIIFAFLMFAPNQNLIGSFRLLRLALLLHLLLLGDKLSLPLVEIRRSFRELIDSFGRGRFGQIVLYVDWAYHR
jgi:hypothetical protein